MELGAVGWEGNDDYSPASITSFIVTEMKCGVDLLSYDYFKKLLKNTYFRNQNC